MNNNRQNNQAGFSIMPLPIFLVWAIIVGWAVHHYTNNLLIATLSGIASFPITVCFLDLIFNNPIALKFQNYAGNHSCPSCHERYTEYTSKPSDNKTIMLKCLKCGAKHRFDKKYHHIEAIEVPETTKAEQVGRVNSE